MCGEEEHRDIISRLQTACARGCVGGDCTPWHGDTCIGAPGVQRHCRGTCSPVLSVEGVTVQRSPRAGLASTSDGDMLGGHLGPSHLPFHQYQRGTGCNHPSPPRLGDTAQTDLSAATEPAVTQRRRRGQSWGAVPGVSPSQDRHTGGIAHQLPS